MFKTVDFPLSCLVFGGVASSKESSLPTVILQGRAVKLQGCNMAVAQDHCAQDEAASFKMTNLVDGYCNVGGL